MFPQNENRNEGMFAKTTFYETTFPRNENRNEGTFGCSPGTKTPERGYVRMFLRNANRNEGTFAKTTLNYETALLSPNEKARLIMGRFRVPPPSWKTAPLKGSLRGLRREWDKIRIHLPFLRKSFETQLRSLKTGYSTQSHNVETPKRAKPPWRGIWGYR